MRDSLEHYAAKCLTIRPKAGALTKLTFNRAQRYLDQRLDEQAATTGGKVRALVLKGRQQGISTYVAARYYHRASHARGVRVFILTHENDATENLFGIVDRYHDHCPALVRPHTGAANAKELRFDFLDSGYAVGTAGAKAPGRSQTVQLFHGSEVAFWPNAADHFAGVVQAIPDLPGTEIILESTANGMGGEFHERWQNAEAGIGDYMPVFIPWFWQEEYRRPVPGGFTPDEEEQDYMAAHGLGAEQMAWRRAKVAELKDPLLFRQEYPASAAEAFQTTGHDSYIPSLLILRARKFSCEGIGPLVCGADPARFGDDRFSIAWRRGRKLVKVESKTKLDIVAGANWCRQVIEQDKPARMFIDTGGLGAGVYDLLKSWGFGDTVRAVNFGDKPMQDFEVGMDGRKIPGPRNRRAEMWKASREWLEDVAGVDIPDKDSLQADACAPAYGYDASQRLQLESKEHMRARGIRSPDEWDAVALTFAEPVADDRKPNIPPPPSGAGGWMAS